MDTKRAKRIHITSSGPRTGSTLLAEVMKVCYDIDCYCDHEAPLCRSNSSFGSCNNILTKNPSETKDIKRILSWDPNLYIICIVRDPRDMICSFHGRIQDMYYCDLQYWHNFVKDYNNLNGNKRVLFIRYEDFTNNPNETQNIISTFLPFLKERHDFSDFHLYAKPVDDSLKALKNLRPIQSSGIGNWKEHLPRIKHQIQKYGSIDDSLSKFGYEINGEWKNKLNTVEVEDFKTYRKTPNRKQKDYKTLMLTYLNIFLERNGINPDKALSPIKRFTQKLS